MSQSARSASPLGRLVFILFVPLLAVAAGAAQRAPDPPSPIFSGVPSPPPDRPLVVVTDNGEQLRVVPLATGLSHPWGMAFLPDGRMLVTERPGRLRMIRDGVLDPKPITGLPTVHHAKDAFAGLQDVAVHPDFAKNHYVYLSYSKAGDRGGTLALARGRLEDGALIDVRDIFVADAWSSTGPTPATGGGTYGGRMLFAPDGTLFLTVGDRDTRVIGNDPEVRMRAQNLGDHAGKVLRLKDDGSAPADNPFVGRAGAKPEIYTYGHRNTYGLAFNPETGDLWACEFGPLGGDELNVLLPGRNYGWPLVSSGRNYTGMPVSEQPWWQPGLEMPVFAWNPVFNPTSILFYTGDRFPDWKRSLIVSGTTRQLQRMSVKERRILGSPRSMLGQLGQRFRQVRQGPDGLLYVLTEMLGATVEDNKGTLLRIEPAAPAAN